MVCNRLDGCKHVQNETAFLFPLINATTIKTQTLYTTTSYTWQFRVVQQWKLTRPVVGVDDALSLSRFSDWMSLILWLWLTSTISAHQCQLIVHASLLVQQVRWMLVQYDDPTSNQVTASNVNKWLSRLHMDQRSHICYKLLQLCCNSVQKFFHYHNSCKL